MRRYVRYTPLGQGRPVTILLDGNTRRDASILDESVKGLGLKVQDVSGIAIGGRLVVESFKEHSTCTVMRIVGLPQGGYLVGLEYEKTS